ncbi:hypothetical protein Aduo_002341 [Ancylostoma duodenale]
MVPASPYRDAIIQLHCDGLPAREISKRLKVSRKLVYDIIRRYRELETNSDRKRLGRTVTVCTKANVRKIRERKWRNPARSVRKLSREMESSRTSSRSIIVGHLEMKCYKKTTGHFLTEAMKMKRKQRCKKLIARFKHGSHLSILFTDEKLFTVEQVLNRQNDRVYSNSKPDVVVQRSSHPASVLVFGAISSDGKMPLLFVPQGLNVNSNNYLEDVMKKHVLPWTKDHFKGRSWTF